MKKILIDLEKLKDRYVGLGEFSFRFAEALAKKEAVLRNKGIELFFIVPDAFHGYWGKNIQYLDRNIFLRFLPSMYPLFDIWHSVHQTSGFYPASKSKNIILTIHDLNFMYEKEEKKAEKYRKKLQHKMDRAHHITSVSNFSISEIEKYMAPLQKPIHLIYNGVANPLAETRTRPAQLREDPFLFHISSLTEKKNTLSLIKMMRLLPEKTLVVAGDWEGNYASQMMDLMQEWQITNVIRLHKPSTEEKNWLYEHCEAFLFPSFYEGFGLPVIEAFHAGKPVFSSRLSSLEEIGSDLSCFWEHFGPEYMANHLRENLPILSLNTKLSEKRKKYAAHFDWDHAADQYISLYLQVLNKQ